MSQHLLILAVGITHAYLIHLLMTLPEFYRSEDWTVDEVVAHNSHFKYPPRISLDSADLTRHLQGCGEDGVPLVIEGLHKHPEWEAGLFNLEYFVGQVDSSASFTFFFWCIGLNNIRPACEGCPNTERQDSVRRTRPSFIETRLRIPKADGRLFTR